MENKEQLVASPLKNGEAIILDEESFETLKSMLTSNNEEDHKMAQLTLAKCDLEKSIYWIWRLSRISVVWRMVNLRTKSGRYIRDNIDLFSICQKGIISFTSWLIEKKWLTQEIFSMLEKDYIDQTSFRLNSDLYDIYIKIKPEFEHLAKRTDLIKLESDE